jgi:hypothetical protein
MSPPRVVLRVSGDSPQAVGPHVGISEATRRQSARCFVYESKPEELRDNEEIKQSFLGL